MKLLTIIGLTILISCNDSAHFEAVNLRPETTPEAETPPITMESGDIIIVSGGTVNSATAPFPLHKVALFNSIGTFKKFLYEASSAEFMYGGALDPVTGDFLFGIDTVDRVDRIDGISLERSSAILDVNLTGITIRGIESLSDGSILIAESPTAIEKFSPAGVRAAAPYPLTIPTAINNIKKISGDRFVVTFTTNPDSPRVYSNAGALVATFPATSTCTTNCDPYDVVELPDGRFAVNSRITHGIYLYSSTFVYVGVLYLNSSVINLPSAMAVLANDNLLVCNTSFNTCDELVISGNTATRVGTTSLIDSASTVRQPLSVQVVP